MYLILALWIKVSLGDYPVAIVYREGLTTLAHKKKKKRRQKNYDTCYVIALI